MIYLGEVCGRDGGPDPFREEIDDTCNYVH